MAEQISGTNENLGNEAEVDPWLAAFAALEPKAEEDNQANSNDGNVDGNSSDEDSSSTGREELPNQDASINGNASEDAVGGYDSDDGGTGTQGNVFEKSYGLDEQSVQQIETEFNERINKKVINDVAQEFINRGYKNSNGVLGVTINDPEVRKNDEDGVPHFYNLYTGEEIRGENPRAKCQELIDDYNSNLAAAFNKACAQYEQFLREKEEPMLAVKKFAPRYEKLDPIRQQMFDNVISDYEIKDDDGDVIGYSCDLDKALALVEKQITTIQTYAKNMQQQQPQQQKPSGPALDMKNSSGAIQAGDVQINSLEQALEFEQNKLLDSLKK